MFKPTPMSLLTVFVMVAAILITQFGFTPQNALAQSSDSFVFTAAGDHGMPGQAQTDASMNAVGTSGSHFYIALGDLSYASNQEQAWCQAFKAKLNDIELIAGNHDVGEGSGGNINTYAQFCPFTLGQLSGSYAKQYYFDYPQTGTPIARFILIAPGVSGSLNIKYNLGGAGYTFTQSAIDGARTAGIPWVIVGMHKNCISVGDKPCEVGTDIMDLLITKKVDLILQGHDHNYQRSHALKCIKTGTTDPSCIADHGSDGTYVKGSGPVIIINGEFGKSLYNVKATDSEAGYFAKTDSTTWGITKYTLSATQLNAQYLRSSGGSLSDTFTIQSGTQPPVSPMPSVSIAPSGTNSCQVMGDTNHDGRLSLADYETWRQIFKLQ